MRPSEFTAFAERLVVQPATTPASIRSASSRAYYGAYHLVREYLEQLGLRPGAQHNLHLWFADCSEPHGKRIGRLLSSLQSNRIKSDYRLDEAAAEDPQSARRAVEEARQIESLLAACQQEPVRSILRNELERLQF